MRKILSAVLCFALILTSGCSKLLYNKYDPDLSIGEQIKTRHYKGHPSDFGKGELFEEIMDATDKKETGRIKDLFSDYALEQNENLEDEINRYFKNKYDLKVISKESGAIGAAQIAMDVYNGKKEILGIEVYI
jgi:hypothetical protein